MKTKNYEVEAMIVKPRHFENQIRVMGTVLGNESVVVRSEISGRVAKIFFTEGNNTDKGQILIKLDDSELQAQLKKYRTQKALSLTEEQRQKKLLEIKAISQNEYDKALTELESIMADIDLVMAKIEKTEIKAPFSGKIGLRQISEGDLLSPSTAITTVTDLSTVKIEFAFPARYVSFLSARQIIACIIPGISDTVKAEIYAFESAADAITGTVMVRAKASNPGLKIIPGTKAEITINLALNQETIMIPTSALNPEVSGQKVFVFKAGKARLIPVITGTRTETSVEIEQGLNPGDTLILTGLLHLRDGDAVKVNLGQN